MERRGRERKGKREWGVELKKTLRKTHTRRMDNDTAKNNDNARNLLLLVLKFSNEYERKERERERGSLGV